MKSRRAGRELALQALYACDSLDVWSEATVQLLFEVFHPVPLQEEQGISPELLQFAHTLIRGVIEHRGIIDESIARASTRWALSRMCQVDRNILRLATYELMYELSTPVSVVINEAIEIAKRFSADDAPTFVNGVLDRVAQGTRAEELKARTALKAASND